MLAVVAGVGTGCEAGDEPRGLSRSDYASAVREVSVDGTKRIEESNDRIEEESASYREALGALDAPAGLEDEQRRLADLGRQAFGAVERLQTTLLRAYEADLTPAANLSIERDAVVAVRSFVRARSARRRLLARLRREASLGSPGRDFARPVLRLSALNERRSARVQRRGHEEATTIVRELRALEAPASLTEEHERLTETLGDLYDALRAFDEAEPPRAEVLVPMTREIVALNAEAAEASSDVARELR